jgi:predicted GNAT superfamily acetyltransferase
MVERFAHTHFLGRALSSQRCFVYGPVCVARERRGEGVLRGLYDALRREVAGDYDAGTLFIAKDNPRSLAAHADGLGMTLAGDFGFDNRDYWILAFAVPLPPHC